jgi:hypothetical protein
MQAQIKVFGDELSDWDVHAHARNEYLTDSRPIRFISR